MSLPIQVDPVAIEEFCRRHHITKFAFFGSVLTDRFGPESDIDVLFEYDRKHVPSLFDVVEWEYELANMLGRKVDLRTPQDLSKYFRDDVVRKSLVQYAA